MKLQFPIEGYRETLSPSYVMLQPTGDRGVTTSLPQPHTHLCMAVQ